MRLSLRETAARLLLLTAGLVAALLLLEGFLRLVDPLGQRLRGDLIVLPTNTRVVLTQTDNPKLEREIVTTRNSLGFRGPDPPADFERRLTLVAVGGSTTECRYLTDGKDWPAALGRELQGSFEGLWIDNAGLDGHSTFGHLKLLEQRVLRLRPKVVLFLLGINDVARDRLKYQDRALTERRDLEASARWLNWAARHSAVVSLVQNALRAREAQRVPLIQPVLALERLPHDSSGRRGRAVARAHRVEFVPGYRERVRALVRACQQAGIEPVLLTQPALYGPAVDDLTGVDLGTIEVDPQDGTNGAMAWATLEAYNDAVREVGRSESALVVDVGRELPKSSRYFYDFVHFTNEGAAEVARLTARALCPALAARFPWQATRPCPRCERQVTWVDRCLTRPLARGIVSLPTAERGDVPWLSQPIDPTPSAPHYGLRNGQLTPNAASSPTTRDSPTPSFVMPLIFSSLIHQASYWILGTDPQRLR